MYYRGLMSICVVLLTICPEQQFLPLTGLDSTQVVTDPVTGTKGLLRKVYAYTGQALEIVGTACDPDNDDPNYPPQTLKVWREPSMTELPLDPNGDYRLNVTYATNGWHYETVCLTDGILTRKGTIAIYTRTNKPPTLGCGGLAR